MKVIAHLLAQDAAIPNHPRWPLLVYPGAVAIQGPNPALAFEELFTSNRWPAAWRTVTAKPGDVIVLPAGTGHKKLSSRGALGIVGAYPEGQHPDTCMPALARVAMSRTGRSSR